MKGTADVIEKRKQRTTQVSSPYRADVLLVTVTEVETQAVRALILRQGGTFEKRIINDQAYFDLGMIGDARVFLIQSEMGAGGSGGAILVVYEAIKSLSPTSVILVGIAFGLRPGEQNLGDILISQQLVGYEVQKVDVDPPTGEAVKDLVESAGMKVAKEARTGSESWAMIRARGDRPHASSRLLTHFRASVFNWPGPAVYFGPILSGEKLIDHEKFRNKLLFLEPEAIGGEMEGTGIYSAASRQRIDWILVKAICDWADGKKSEDKSMRQQQAAENAARFTLHVLRQGELVEPSTTSRETNSMALPSRQAIGTTLFRYDIHSGYVVAVAWEPDGNRVASAGADGLVRVWDTDAGETLLTYRGHTRLFEQVNTPPTIYTVAWSPDGSRLASAGDGTQVHVWDAATGQDIIMYTEHSGLLPDIFALAWSPDGKRIASACSAISRDKTIHVWDTKHGQAILRCPANEGVTPNFSILALSWSPDGTHISACGSKQTFRIWNAITGGVISTLKSRSRWMSDLAWSPDSKLLAIATADHTAEIWDAAEEKLLLSYRGHADSVRAIAWSPNGRLLATASNDTTVQIWNAGSGTLLYTYRGHTGWTTSLAWSPDGKRIASGSNDGTVQIWQAV